MPPTWERDVMATPRVITKVKPRKPSVFQSVLLAIAGHNPRQPLQVIQGAHGFLAATFERHLSDASYGPAKALSID
jgi:hypothetical protein